MSRRDTMRMSISISLTLKKAMEMVADGKWDPVVLSVAQVEEIIELEYYHRMRKEVVTVSQLVRDVMFLALSNLGIPLAPGARVTGRKNRRFGFKVTDDMKFVLKSVADTGVPFALISVPQGLVMLNVLKGLQCGQCPRPQARVMRSLLFIGLTCLSVELPHESYIVDVGGLLLKA